MTLLTQFRTDPSSLHIRTDIIAGIIVALVSIPISMGYAQIAGLPVVYGLYGSLLPILVFGLLSTSPQFVVGVDAMPAAMAGALLAEFGIAAESPDALQLVPLLSFLTAAWFVLFYFIRAGRIVRYISTPVMGGFISGVGLTIILMQVPKLFGGNAGTGELPVLLKNIWDQRGAFHPLSALLGFGTVAVILLFKKLAPKIPMTVIMMGVGALLTVCFHVDRFGVRLLPEVAPGLPRLFLPSLSYLGFHTADLFLQSLSIAGVVMAQTLLATGNYAFKYGDSVDNNRELLAYAAMNAAGGAVGCCPINGSVSRSGIADSFGARSQIMSLSAAATMLIVLLFGTPLLRFLPVPILTGIVMTALIGILETKLFARLWKTSRNEWAIFLIACLGVLLFGTVNGVVIGCLLSFAEVAVSASKPPTALMGRIPGQGNFYSLQRNSMARPIRHAVIYRFSGNLFFANADIFQKEIEQAIRPDTRVVVVDARGITRIDVTAVDRLLNLNRKLKARGIHFYLAEHSGALNDQLKALGAGSLLEEGAVRRTITLALQDVGIEKPYTLLKDNPYVHMKNSSILENEQVLAEMEWVFGKDAGIHMQRLAEQTALLLQKKPEVLEQTHLETMWGHLNPLDENELLEEMELYLEELMQKGELETAYGKRLQKRVEERRILTEQHLKELDPASAEKLRINREKYRTLMKELHPEEYRRIQELQLRYYQSLKKKNPELAAKILDFYEQK